MATKKHKIYVYKTSGLMFVACIVFLSDSAMLGPRLGLNLDIHELVRG